MQKRTAVLIVAVLGLLCLAGWLGREYRLPPLIRLHILANSDSAQDQALKYKIRDHVVTLMGEKFKEAESIEESRDILRASLDELEEEARLTLREAGSPDGVRAVYGIFDFPARQYDTFSLPAGKYEALRLVIGKGQGANWWCVLFPPLCFVDAQKTTGYDTPLAQQEALKIKPAFKVVELCKKAVQEIAAKTR